MSDSPARAAARARLHEAIHLERRSIRRRRFWTRGLVAGVALFLAMTAVPKSVDPDLQPLLGLADAVETMPRVAVDNVDLWYSRSERVDLVVVPDDFTGDLHLEFLLPSVLEVWVGMGDTERRVTTYGTPVFFSPEDSRMFAVFDLAEHYPTEQTVEEIIPIGEIAYLDNELLESPANVYAALRRQVAGLGDRRSEEVALLRLSARLMQTHGGDPRVRGAVLRVIADIPGIAVTATARTIDVSFDYVDGDRPLRLSYGFDAETAYLVSESLAVLASRTEPATVVSQANYDPLEPAGGFVGS